MNKTTWILAGLGLAAACGKGAPAAPAASAPAIAIPTATPITWASKAQDYRSQVGQQVSVLCPPNGTAGPLWGSDTYSDDSSICTAALHSGRVTVATGGPVTIQIMPGMPSYAATTRNGVTSSAWGPWSGSFSIVGGPAPGLVAVAAAAAPPPPPPGAASWSTDGRSVVQTGQSVIVVCPPGGAPGSVWGTDVYTNDSSVCTAAVHAGLAQLATGGTVRVTGLPGMPSYAGSARNGITTSNYGTWSGSFRVEPATAPAGELPPGPPPGKPL